MSEIEDCFFNNQGDLYVSDPMGGIFKTDCNAYSLGATGTPGTNTSTGGTNSKSNNIFISLITKINNDLADSLQSVMENFERNNSFAKLTYSTTEIDADTELKEKLQVVSNLSGTSEDNEDTNTIHPEKLKGTVLDKTGNPQTVYTTTTEIPYLLVSFDNLLLDRLSFTDIDFFGNSNTNSNWQDIRQLISKLTKAVLFICSALMLIMLIYRSIMLIVAVIQGNPNISTKSKEIMDNLFGCIAIIVFTYVLMALMIYFSKLILNIALNGNTSSFLVRLDVEDVYSFNTNFAGYFKYLSQDGSFLHSLGRLIANGLKLLLCFAMSIRVILLGGLTAISPIAAINYMKKNSVEQEEEVKGIFHLGPLIKLYSRIVFEPVILGVFLIIFMRI